MQCKKIITKCFTAIVVTFLSAFSLLLPHMAASASDSTFTVGSWEYGISSGTVYVSSYVGSSTSVTVPTSVTYSGTTYYIRSVGSGCFEGNTSLQSVTIPSQITTIGTCAFKDCTLLRNVTIMGDLTDFDSGSAGTWSYNHAAFYNTGTNAASFTVTFQMA